MNHDLPAFVQEAFDAIPAGGDPLADPRVAEWLEGNPEQLEVFARISADLRSLGAMDPLTTARPVPRPVGTGIAIAAAAALALWLWPRHEPAPDRVLPRPSFAGNALVRHCELREHVIESGRSFSATSQRGAIATRRRATLQTTQLAAPLISRCATTVTHEQTLLP